MRFGAPETLRRAIVQLALGGLAPLVPLAVWAAPPDAGEVKQLLLQLGSETRRERVDAEQRLLELGPELLESLPPADLIETATAREAVGRVRRQLELDAARQSIRPRPAALRGTKTLRDWATELRTETGNDVDVAAEDRDRMFALDIATAPFWQVVQTAGWSPRYDAATNRVSLGPARPGLSQPADASGIFRVAAEAVRRGSQVHVTLELWGEPRIRPLYATVADSAISLVRGDRHSTPVSPDARREIPMTGRGPANVTVPLDFPAARFAQLEGTVQVKTAAFPERVEFDRLAEGGPVSRRRGGATVTFHAATFHRAELDPPSPPTPKGETGGSVKIRLTIAYDHGGPEFESHRLWLYHNEAWLEAKGNGGGSGESTGRRLAIAPEIDSLEEANGALALDYRFPGVTQDLSELHFVYVVPTLILDVPVSFRIPDLAISDEPAASPKADPPKADAAIPAGPPKP